VFENRVLKRIFGPKRDKVTGECRKLRNEEFNDLYFSPIIQVIKSRRMRLCSMWGRGEKGIWWRNPSERDCLKNPGIGGRITLRWIFKKWDGGA